MQHFKGDDVELKFYNVIKPLLDVLNNEKQLFLDDVYNAAPLGDVLYNSKRAPLANAIAQSIFRLAFKEIFEAFKVAGTFPSYITVFKKIFGDSVEIDFSVPAPGKLNIDIIASGVEFSDFVARYIENNSYLFDEVIDDEGDNIVFQTVKGFTSQYELEQMLFELVPNGIYTTITLDLGA